MSNNVGIVTGDEWARIFFKLDHIDGVKSLYRCVQCHAGSQLYTCHTGHGYTNLKNHVTAKHPETFSDMVNEFKGNKNGNTLLNHSNMTGKRVTKDGTKYFNWLQYCVFLDHPLTAADNKLLTAITKLQPTCTNSLKKYFLRVGLLAALNVGKTLPENFGILFDGWTSNHSKEHYVILVALFMKDGVLHSPLLACSPMDTLGEFGAVAHMELITTTLAFYFRTIKNLQFATGDNCSTNKRLADIMEIPLVGCASHRLNLAVQDFLSLYPDTNILLTKVNVLMKDLKRLKNAAIILKLKYLEN